MHHKKNKIGSSGGFYRQIDAALPKALKIIPGKSVGRCSIVLLAIVMLLGIFSPARADYSYKKQITLKSAKVSGASALTNFPVLISIPTDNDLRDHVTDANGYDIIFKDSGGTPLDHEIERYVSTSGKLVAWVRIPALSASTDTVITMYYGDSSVTSSTENVSGVWDSNFKGVWHLKENPAGVAPQMKDSSGYGNHGIARDDSWNLWNASDRVTGKMGYGTYFHDTGGSDKRIDVGNDSSLNFTTGMTLEAWVKPDQVDETNRPVIYKGNTYKMDAMRSYNVTPDVYVYIQDNGWQAKHPPSALTAAWHHLVGTYDASDRTMRIYIDGNERANKTLSGLSSYLIRPTTEVLTLAKKDLEGILDEARVSNIARSSDWIK